MATRLFGVFIATAATLVDAKTPLLCMGCRPGKVGCTYIPIKNGMFGKSIRFQDSEVRPIEPSDKKALKRIAKFPQFQAAMQALAANLDTLDLPAHVSQDAPEAFEIDEEGPYGLLIGGQVVEVQVTQHDTILDLWIAERADGAQYLVDSDGKAAKVDSNSAEGYILRENAAYSVVAHVADGVPPQGATSAHPSSATVVGQTTSRQAPAAAPVAAPAASKRSWPC